MARIKEAEAQATAGGAAQAGLEAELRAKETELARLAQELRRAQGVAERAEAAQREAAEAGGVQLQAAEQAAAALEDQLAAWPSVEAHEKLRQQLRAMRRVVGGGSERPPYFSISSHGAESGLPSSWRGSTSGVL